MADKKMVFPGDFLTAGEEFTPGENAIEDDDGNVIATTVGNLQFDEQKRVVSVQKKGAVARPMEQGALVIAKVSLVKENMVVVEMLQAEKNGVPLSIGQSSATIMISRVSRAYVKDLNDAFCVGDWVKAKVVEVSDYGVELMTAEPTLGVIKAFCAHCRQPLGMFSGRLKCPNCGAMAFRTLSQDYALKQS